MEKTKTAVLALILTLIVATPFITCLQVINAQVSEVDSHFFLAVSPNPIGVGQTATLNFWHTQMPRPETDEELAANTRAGWYDVTVTIRKPDGTTQTLGPYKTDPIGAYWDSFVPEQIGTYYLQVDFPGQWRNYTWAQIFYKPTKSAEVALTVQQDPIEQWPEAELPTDYWERPISAEFREWWPISGDWIGGIGGPPFFRGGYNSTGNFNPYTKAPNSAHIVWTKPIYLGGLVGGEMRTDCYYTGLSYEIKFGPPIIMSGRLYYNIPMPTRYSGFQVGGGFVCVDLRTGEQLWWQNGTISCGQNYYYYSPNQDGVIPYLWKTGSTYKMYDAFTGNWILDMENAMSGSVVYSPIGDMLVYVISPRGDWLAMWNSSRVQGMLRGESGSSLWQWTPPVGATLDWLTGVQWNVSVTPIPGIRTGLQTFQRIIRVSSDVIMCANTLADLKTVSFVGYSAETGEQLWTSNITTDAGHDYNHSPIIDGVFTYFRQEELKTYGFNAYTGKQIWGPTDPYENAWAMYYQSYAGAGAASPSVGYGKLFATSYDGMVHCHDLETGDLLWNYDGGSSGYETVYGTFPFYGSVTMADNKVYAANNEHSPMSPPWRGAKLHCIDVESGVGIWNVSGWYLPPAVADGYLVTHNNYDGLIYCFGKGKTATTVTVQDDVVSLGQSVLIKGMVTDQSPGAKDTPAIADVHMSEWMEYIYMQKPMPMDATGVEVVLETLDPNGDFYEIGRVTSDAAGMYKMLWEPPDEGEYTIVASFGGSESYWRSTAETAIGVTESSGGQIEAAPELVIVAAVAIIAVMAIVAFWLIRRH